MKQYKAVIFDLDGTLLNTAKGVLKSVDYTIKQLNLPALSEEVKRTFIGPPIRNSFINVYKLNEQQADIATNIFRDRYKNTDLLEADLYDGLLDLLELLKNKGILIGVATYKRQDYAIKILEHFGISAYCQSVKGADFESKLTKADILRLCLQELKVKAGDEIVLIGDSEYDAIGAKELNVDFIGVTYGFGFKDKIDALKYKNVFFADNITELISFFKE